MSDEFAALLAESFDALSTAEKLAVTAQWEAFTRKQAVLGHRLMAEIERAPQAELGETSAANALSILLHISKDEALRRLKESRELAPRVNMLGEVLEPVLTGTAAAQARGQIGSEHVRVIRKFLKKLPSRVGFDEREAAEAQLAEIACTLTPEELRVAADRLATLLDQDGEFTDIDRAQRRYLTIGKQQPDGMSDVRGRLDPQGRAVLDTVLAKLAAPGMCNPEDDAPSIDGDPSPESVSKDLRTTGQRNHDALTAMGRALLASGSLGNHNGLPATMVITTTLAELESGQGHAVSGGGTLIPMTEVIRQASAAHHYLLVYKNHTEEPLYLARAKRLASKGQRIVLYAKDRGCTRPGCTAPAYHSQVHHAVADWADDGQTDITDLTLACGPDNRRVKPGGWRTRKRKDGRTEWLPPPQLDTGQARVNNYHHPQRYLVPDDCPSDDDEGENGPASV